MTKKEKFFSTQKTGWGSTALNYSGYGVGRQHGGKIHIYGYDPDGLPFEYFVTYQRSKTIKKMLNNGEWWEVPIEIRLNYSTNGYNTRRGIKRANVKECKKMHDSHALIPKSGKDAHDMRVFLRNK